MTTNPSQSNNKNIVPQNSEKINPFATLLERFKIESKDTTTTAYADTLTNLATAVAYSVLKKCIDNGYNETLVSIRHELTRDRQALAQLTYASNNATQTVYNDNGDMTINIVDKDLNKALADLTRQTLGDGLDLVHTAIVAILDEVSRQTKRGEETDLEKPYTVRRLKRKVWIKSEDSVNGWETVETTPIREIYKAVRSAVSLSRAAATDPRNGYSYIEDLASDPDSGEETTIYRRLTKYADLGGYACDFNGACTLYSVDIETVKDTDALIECMNLTKKQAQVLALRQSGYGYKAIATYLGVTQRAVAKTVEAIQKKAGIIGLTPNK